MAVRPSFFAELKRRNVLRAAVLSLGLNEGVNVGFLVQPRRLSELFTQWARWPQRRSTVDGEGLLTLMTSQIRSIRVKRQARSRDEGKSMKAAKQQKRPDKGTRNRLVREVQPQFPREE